MSYGRSPSLCWQVKALQSQPGRSRVATRRSKQRYDHAVESHTGHCSTCTLAVALQERHRFIQFRILWTIQHILVERSMRLQASRPLRTAKVTQPLDVLGWSAPLAGRQVTEARLQPQLGCATRTGGICVGHTASRTMDEQSPPSDPAARLGMCGSHDESQRAWVSCYR